ncbi:carbamoyltransferase C-terminal domain-containing protein, partial [Chlamydiota bacterium]
GALGAVFFVWHQYLDNERKVNERDDSQQGSYLGPHYPEKEILKFLAKEEIEHERFESKDELSERLAEFLDEEKVIGFFQGRMEFGPRALGARSIIGDPRSENMQTYMNLKIKFRESFRPFAPVVLEEDANRYFDIKTRSPYMLLVAPVRENLRKNLTGEEKKLWGIEKLKIKRSKLPAITHVDYSARLQTVNEFDNPFFYKILTAFKERTGCSVLINTSFNVRGEPIVCTPLDAYLCFMRTNMDYLVLENCLLDKQKMKAIKNDVDWQKEIKLD